MASRQLLAFTVVLSVAGLLAAPRLSAQATGELRGTVTDEAPLVDTRNARVGISATSQVLASLPLGRNFASIASIVPGVGTDVLGLTFYGAPSLENTFLVDWQAPRLVRLGVRASL